MNVTAEMIWSFVLAATSAFLLISNAIEKIVGWIQTQRKPYPPGIARVMFSVVI